VSSSCWQAEAWASWVELELGLNNFVEAEQLFGRCLMDTPSVRLWTVYLNYIRRRNDLNNDASGQARKIVSQAYDFVINTIGIDKDSAKIWQDYIQLLRSGPGQIGGGNWQDQQKMDQLRKAYQKAICVPTSAVNTLWKEYDQFETGVNKLTVSVIKTHGPLAWDTADPTPRFRVESSSRSTLRRICRPRVRTSPLTT
jgi:cleavage stimulation factor subunit 3